MKKLLAIILTIATLILAAVFNWHGETAKAAKAAGGEDGTKIVYTCFTGNSSNGRDNLCVMNADGSGKYQIPDTNNVIENADSPRFDPDAEKVIFLSQVFISQGNSRHRLAIVNADGTNARLLFDGEQYDANDYTVFTFGISPDGGKIAFVTRPRNGNPLDKVLWLINSDGSGLTQLAAGDIYAMFPAFTNGIQQFSPGIQHISFSPDGSKVAVSINNSGGRFDVFLVNINGSGMTRIADSQNPASSVDPVFSPDGSNIVFSELAANNNYRLAIRNTDGSNKVVLADQGINFTASFNPDGDRIVFHSTRNSTAEALFASYDIYTIKPDGTNETRLTFNSAPSKSGLATFDPFGEKIVFNATPAGGFQDMEVYAMNPNGNSVTALTNSPGEPHAKNPSYGNGDLDGDGVKNTLDNCRLVSNPNQTNTDGDTQGNTCDADDDNDGVEDQFDNCPLAVNRFRVAFTNGVDVWAMNTNGSNLVRLTTASSPGFQIFNDEPSFSADGRRILFTSNRNNNRDEIFVMNADGTNRTRITNRSSGDASDDDNAAVFNPAATKIAFKGRRRVSGNTNNNLFVMNADGTNQTPLTFFTGILNYAGNPNFNHNGTRIVYEALAGNLSNYNTDIYAINPDGTNTTRLTTAAGYDTDPAYSPDGSKIVFISQRNGGGNNNNDIYNEVYIMNADGTNQTRLTNTTESEYEPTFTPDGTKIAFSRNRVDTKLYLMDLDGSNVRRVSAQVGAFYENHATFAPQADSDGDGTGDVCDASFDANTPTGANVAVQAPSATVSFSDVSQAGTTSFTPIVPNQNQMPNGYTLCPNCPAYDITTTAAVTPPITVCLGVPASVPQPTFLQMRLLHGENGVPVDRTTERVTDGNGQRFVCGNVSSLSPFILASNAAVTAATAYLSGQVTANGRGVSNASVQLNNTATGETRTVLTNAFGYYRFEEVGTGSDYVISVRHKRHQFAPRFITVQEDLDEVNFSANEN